MTRGFAAAVAVAASLGAGVVHLALGPEHLEELGALGWGFYLAAALQVGWAVVLLAAVMLGGTAARGRLRRIVASGVAINVAILGAWVVSRTVGLPSGETPWVPEAIGRADTITAALEVVIIAAVVVLRGTRAAAVARRPHLATALAVLLVAAGTVVALAPEASHADGHEAMMGMRSAP